MTQRFFLVVMRRRPPRATPKPTSVASGGYIGQDRYQSFRRYRLHRDILTQFLNAGALVIEDRTNRILGFDALCNLGVFFVHDLQIIKAAQTVLANLVLEQSRYLGNFLRVITVIKVRSQAIDQLHDFVRRNYVGLGGIVGNDESINTCILEERPLLKRLKKLRSFADTIKIITLVEWPFALHIEELA